jgi:hypothetical protein
MVKRPLGGFKLGVIVLCAGVICAVFGAAIASAAAPHRSAAGLEALRDGLRAGQTVPAWAKHKSIHFLPSPGKAASHPEGRRSPRSPGRTPSTGFSSNLETRCETSYCPTPPLVYLPENEGVEHKPSVHLIFWGSNWTKAPGSETRTALLELFHGLTNSPYQGILGQYFDHTGRIGSEVEVSEYVDTSVAAPAEVEGSKIEEEALRTVANRQWPTEINDQYVVLPAPGTTYTVSSAPFCAYHAWISEEVKETFAFVPYMGDKPFNACLSADPERNPAHVTSAAAAHEYAETTTNPHIGPGRSAWTTTDAAHYEIADICQFEDVQLSNGTWASALWDNSQNECSQADSAKPELYAQTKKATDVGPHEADLHANVYGEGLETEYHFEYGLTTSYGTSTPSGTLKAGGAIDAPKEVDLLVNGLELEKSYHYRLVASNSSGAFHGQDHVFNTSQWSIQQTAPLPEGAISQERAMNNVSCTSATFCAAVGYYYKSSENHFVTDAETWNGTQWTLQPTPNPSGSVGSELQKVSCKSESFCMAVGYYHLSGGKPKTLTERWNGSEWSIVASPNPSEAVGAVKLRGVSCASTTSCTAVGNYVTQLSGGLATEEKTLVETWSGGSEWSIKASPNPSGQAVSSLGSVSCSTTVSCIAIGSGSQEAFGKESVPLAESYE